MNYEQALKLDERNNNHKWRDCTQLEVTQLNEYETFTDLGKDGVHQRNTRKSGRKTESKKYRKP